MLATVLFTDIIGSTERAAQLGDRGWRDLVDRHHATVRVLLARFRGTEVDTGGDGCLASFDGPARAVRRHTTAGKIGGLAVSIGARIAAEAAPSEVLVSQTVKDLVAGSSLLFEDRGTRELRGIPRQWRVYATRVEGAGSP